MRPTDFEEMFYSSTVLSAYAHARGKCVRKAAAQRIWWSRVPCATATGGRGPRGHYVVHARARQAVRDWCLAFPSLPAGPVSPGREITALPPVWHLVTPTRAGASRLRPRPRAPGVCACGWFPCKSHSSSRLPSTRPCLVSKNFSDSPLYRIFRRMHGVLNIDENKN